MAHVLPLRPGSFRCPAHEDRSPSLHVTQAPDGTWLLRCFAGCETADILTALGLVWADLFPDPSRPCRPRLTLPAPTPGDMARVIAEALAIDREQRRRREPWVPHLVSADAIREAHTTARYFRGLAMRLWQRLGQPDDPPAGVWCLLDWAATAERAALACEATLDA